MPGHTLVLPVALSSPPAQPNGAAFRATIVGAGPARTVDARLVWIASPPAPASEPTDPALRWTPGLLGWSTELPPLPREPESRGSWAFVLALPPDADAARVRLAGLDIPIRWLPSAPLVAAPREPGRFSVDALLDLTALFAQSPGERWRARLVAERFLPAAAIRFDHPLRGPMSDPALEALATQIEDQWRAALAGVAATDPPLAARLAGSLTALTQFPQGPLAATWPANDASLARLLAALLDPDASSASRNDQARAWLDNLPRAVEWVLDDAGAPAAGGGAVATLGVVSRRAQPAVAWLSREQSGRSRTGLRVPLPGWSAAPVVLAVRSDAPLAALDLHVDDWTDRVLVIAGGLPATPPGGAIAALLDDWTLESWLAGAPRPAVADRATGALLERAPTGPGWRLYVECRTPTGEDAATTPAPATRPLAQQQPPAENPEVDHLTLYLGPTDAPRAVIRVEAPEAAPPSEGAPADPFARTRADDRWTATIPIPSDAIEPDGRLRIALVRVDAAGRRSAWPRPLLPWQQSPGRAAFDLSTWPDITAGPK